MRRTRTVEFVLAAVVVGLALVACRSTNSQPGSSDSAAEEIRSTAGTRMHALVTADLPTLQKMHAADDQLVTPDGDTLSRDDFLDAVGSGDLDYLRFDP